MAKGTVATKLIEAHLVEGEMTPGAEIGLRIDQTLTQDATGTLVMLELEAMGLDRVKTEASAQYVDHNLIQEDYRNPDDHLFLRSAAQRFGVWFSRPGNGVSHPVHQANLGKPGSTMVGSDSHTPAAGAIGMLAMGAGGIEVAMAMAGEPLFIKMPEIWGVKLTGELPDWVSAKDVILEMLRRHDVDGGVNRIIEYYGPGLASLTAMDRHVIANMGTELGATSTVFPSDDEVRAFLHRNGRPDDWTRLEADADAEYDVHEEIDLSEVEPLIARPSSPGNVVRVAEVAGQPIYQSYIGSSANPGYRDFAVAAYMVRNRQTPSDVSLDINPSSRVILKNLMDHGHIAALIQAGARLHQAGCNGCIGMGQAPATGRNSLRTVPRNFPGRSGTDEDAVWLCSPETATASALRGEITDPRAWAADEGVPWIDIPEPDDWDSSASLLAEPPPADEAAGIELEKGPNIVSLPQIEPIPDAVELEVLLEVDDDVSTDEIMPAGAKILPFRSNVPEIANFVFQQVDPTYSERAKQVGDHAVVAGTNYGQGSSREHAAVAPRYLGLRVVIAESYARIHWQNLVNFGVLPLEFCDPDDKDLVQQGDVLVIEGIRDAVRASEDLVVQVEDGESFSVRHTLSERQIEVLLAGGLINWMRERGR